MDVTLRDVDDEAYRALKARAARDGVTVGRAASAAFREWARGRVGSRTLLDAKPVRTGDANLARDVDRVLYGGEHARRRRY